MKTKYGFEFSNVVVLQEKKRLINQLWKILPMRENGEDWENQLSNVIEEISGLNLLYSNKLNFMILLAKLENLFYIQSFPNFRKNIFESITLLDEVLTNVE